MLSVECVLCVSVSVSASVSASVSVECECECECECEVWVCDVIFHFFHLESWVYAFRISLCRI